MYKPGDFVKTERGLYYVVNAYEQQYDIIIADKYVPAETLGAISRVPLWYKTKHKVASVDKGMYYNTIKEVFWSNKSELRKIASGK